MLLILVFSFSAPLASFSSHFSATENSGLGGRTSARCRVGVVGQKKAHGERRHNRHPARLTASLGRGRRGLIRGAEENRCDGLALDAASRKAGSGVEIAGQGPLSPSALM